MIGGGSSVRGKITIKPRSEDVLATFDDVKSTAEGLCVYWHLDDYDKSKDGWKRVHADLSNISNINIEIAPGDVVQAHIETFDGHTMTGHIRNFELVFYPAPYMNKAWERHDNGESEK